MILPNENRSASGPLPIDPLTTCWLSAQLQGAGKRRRHRGQPTGRGLRDRRVATPVRGQPPHPLGVHPARPDIRPPSLPPLYVSTLPRRANDHHDSATTRRKDRARHQMHLCPHQFMELLLGAYSRRVRLRRVEALCASYS